MVRDMVVETPVDMAGVTIIIFKASNSTVRQHRIYLPTSKDTKSGITVRHMDMMSIIIVLVKISNSIFLAITSMQHARSWWGVSNKNKI